MISSTSNKDKEIKFIQDVADELGLKLMTDPELKEFTTKLESGIEFGEYTKENFPFKNLYE